ncbi:MAG: LytR/AlgR family response regulator transcription factor [Gammaproteobacteria bacterium]
MIETVFLVDDEPLARVNLRRAIERFTRWKVILELDNGEGVETYARQLQPSVVFIDIRMPKRSGLAAAAGLLTLAQPPLIVFVSAYSEYALQAFELYALDYLLKPFSDERFQQTVERLQSVADNAHARGCIERQQLDYGGEKKYLQVLIVRSVGVIRVVDLKDVLWFQGCGNYVEVILADEKILHRVSLGFLEENLDPGQFVRCHRGAIVRVAAIREIKTWDDGQMTLGLKNGDTPKLSPAYKAGVLAAIERQ